MVPLAEVEQPSNNSTVASMRPRTSPIDIIEVFGERPAPFTLAVTIRRGPCQAGDPVEERDQRLCRRAGVKRK